ncbi:FTR1 family protein [Microbulbifer hydrolyticus]|uniref:High-affinity iron transporter n=1 Tax=Microbulbifer hydrolyticus TaxID=48074 RepID=A0A6P1TEZ9_9GAMM|nr:FTR1 family protein [Microbulbifer hydrolyticus]MBB5212641.1 high-affinity iron transporter [Microbulbifer hydrolyticus]QHQ40243.1 iron permease [Microbulbifer hydrolyticus]
MLLTSVIIIFREVLEAGLVFCILLAMSRFLGLSTRWFLLALVLGGIGSAVYGNNLAAISNAFDGAGQELLNAGLHFWIYFLLVMATTLMVINYYRPGYRLSLLKWLMLLAVTCSVLREGAEIYIYLYTFHSQPELFGSVVKGALIGAGIGFSIGALLYYLLLGLPKRYILPVTCILLTIVAGGMCSQAAQLLIQVDWLPAQAPLWDSSGLLPEHSLVGQLLFALVSYEASPTPIEVFLYTTSMAVMALILGVTHYVFRTSSHVPAIAH